MWYKNIAGRFFGLVTKHACDRQTDRQTDGRADRQNYDSQDRASIAASRGKNVLLQTIRTDDGDCAFLRSVDDRLQHTLRSFAEVVPLKHTWWSTHDYHHYYYWTASQH